MRRGYPLLTRSYDVELPGLAGDYEGMRILQVSDVHNALRELQCGLDGLVQMARSLTPHLIAITGDLIDKRSPDARSACELVRRLSALAPVLYVSGNHERTPFVGERGQTRDAGEREALGRDAGDLFALHAADIASAGARIIEGEVLAVEPDGSVTAGRAPVGRTRDAQPPRGLAICGVRDPWPLSKRSPGAWERLLADVVGRAREAAGTVILLSHRPEHARLYDELGVDLALVGHAHGGQVRLPLIGAVVAPNQGMLPKYTRGVYRVGGCTMVVSTGLGTSSYRLRMLCPPELVLVTLHGEQKDRTQR